MCFIKVRTREEEKKLAAEGKLYYCVVEYETDDDGTTITCIYKHFKTEKEMYDCYNSLRNFGRYGMECYKEC